MNNDKDDNDDNYTANSSSINNNRPIIMTLIIIILLPVCMNEILYNAAFPRGFKVLMRNFHVFVCLWKYLTVTHIMILCLRDMMLIVRRGASYHFKLFSTADGCILINIRIYYINLCYVVLYCIMSSYHITVILSVRFCWHGRTK